MTRPAPLIAGILGVVFLVIAAVYWLTPAGSLPTFFPGFVAGAAQVHVKHALGSLIVALILFALAWSQSARAPSVRPHKRNRDQPGAATAPGFCGA